MPAKALAQEIKVKNIIDIALGFSSMTRVFSKGSNAEITKQLEQLLKGLDRIRDRESYERVYADFCYRFSQTIRTAEKKLKDGRVKPSHACSFGQGAKVPDIAAKVYAYYCDQPTADVARRLVPMLHGALDNGLMKYLANGHGGVSAKSIEDVDREQYEALQSLVARDIEKRFQSEICPVQWDDIVWREQNRPQDAGVPSDTLQA